ncbi:MAG: hypothetical protein RM368_38340 [Nostoc sp. DedSLP03]|uniref:hypothetical protein n=1 Tax=Nostoc sp. DedSLP03 TaxID=3075400 RepID=UPI002AD4F8DA|nr:hypothetical protein [Nostoc sp. DedSLP03]MDZ7970722.1 hypothetical protein [Nostoc sp. DedSLP03]
MTLLELTANLIWVYIPLTRSYLHFGCDRSNYGSLLDRRDRVQVIPILKKNATDTYSQTFVLSSFPNFEFLILNWYYVLAY